MFTPRKKPQPEIAVWRAKSFVNLMTLAQILIGCCSNDDISPVSHFRAGCGHPVTYSRGLRMSLHFLFKRLITTEVPLSSHSLFIASSLLPPLEFNATPNIKITHFCTQTAAPSTTPLDAAVFTEFLLNKCGFREEDITKAFGHCNVLHRKSIQDLEQVLVLLYGCGLTTPAQIRRVVRYNPKVFFSLSESNLNSRLSFLRTFMKEEHVSKLVYSHPRIFNYREHRIKSSILLLKKLGVEGDFLSFLVAWQPRLIVAQEEKVMEAFKQAEDLGVEKGSNAFAAALRGLLGVGKEALDQRLQCLRSLGFSEKQIREISSKKPAILGLSEENLKLHVDFAVNSLGLPLADFVKHAVLFTCSVEKRMIPRYRVIEAMKSMQVLKTKRSLPTIFTLTERTFLEKYVNSNAETCSVLQDIYRLGKAEK